MADNLKDVWYRIRLLFFIWLHIPKNSNPRAKCIERGSSVPLEFAESLRRFKTSSWGREIRVIEQAESLRPGGQPLSFPSRESTRRFAVTT
jgi:hypothetical protein